MANSKEKVDEELINYLLSLSDDDDYSEEDDMSEHLNYEENSDSDNSDIMVHSKRPKVIEENDQNDITSKGIDAIPPPEFDVIYEGSDTWNTNAFAYAEIPGPKHAPSPTADPRAYFNLFFTPLLWKLFTQETNRYAEQFLAARDTLSPRSRVRQWRNATETEMKAFVAIILEMDITKRPTIFSYWANNSRAIPWFGKMMSRDRFQLLLRFFHLTDNSKLFPPGNEKYDPCAKFQPIVDHANCLFQHYYTPHEHLSIDETLVGTKSHSQLLQYRPNKHHHKWGMKFWMLCDSEVNYCLAFYCYRGAKNKEDKKELQEHGLSFVVVKMLLTIGNYFMKGYHVVVDDFFSSVDLARELYKNQTYLTGKLKMNQKNIPKELREKFSVGERKYVRSDAILFLGQREKKSPKNPDLLLSTKATAKSICSSKKTHGKIQDIARPEIINLYNSYLGRVDTSDTTVYSYLDERRTIKYWKKVAFSVIARMVLNSYIIYKENNRIKTMTRLQYTASIIESLEVEWLAKTESDVSPRTSELKPGLQKLPGRKEKNCVVCSGKYGMNRRRSRTMCIHCNKGVHSICLIQHRCQINT